MSDLIRRQAAIEALDIGAELLKRVLDDTDVVGFEREKYAWGLGLIESYISDMKELPSAEPKTGECSGCKFIGSYDVDFPCVNCVRKTKDYYCGARMRGEEDD